MTGVDGAIGLRLAERRREFGRIPVPSTFPIKRPGARRPNRLVPLLLLSGIIVPTQVQLSLGPGLRFTPGRLAIAILLIPALVALFQSGRRLLLCDLLVSATAVWMIFASVTVAGASALSSSGGDALDLLGGYFVARGLIFGPPAVDAFARVLKIFAITAVLFAVADNLAGRLIVHDTIAAILHTPSPTKAGYRHNMVRAAATFDHEILFGVFSALAATVFLYLERGIFARTAVVGICLLGCVLASSSVALMVSGIALCVFAYDRALSRYSWRWPAFWACLGVLAIVFAGVVEKPLAWIVSHLTLDPQTGYFRMMIWEAATFYVGKSPIFGYAYGLFNNAIVDGSVDAIWLLEALRFGLPMVGLFFLANVAAIFPERRKIKGGDETGVNRMRHAFTLVILLFMFSGLTVHFWNFMWMFWGVCLGVRASLRELTV